MGNMNSVRNSVCGVDHLRWFCSSTQAHDLRFDSSTALEFDRGLLRSKWLFMPKWDQLCQERVVWAKNGMFMLKKGRLCRNGSFVSPERSRGGCWGDAGVIGDALASPKMSFVMSRMGFASKMCCSCWKKVCRVQVENGSVRTTKLTVRRTH